MAGRKEQNERFEMVKDVVAGMVEILGIVKPADLVNEARNPESPLHDEFEWDDTAAAEGFRLVQAGALIRRMKITVVRQGADPKVVTLRLYHSLPTDRAAGGGYRSLPVITASPDMTADLRAQAIRDLQSFRKKYETLVDLAPVMRAIDEVS